jgi:hypothetical protein
MLNLLPKDYKNEIRREYLRRFSIVLLIILSLVDVFVFVAIFPSYILISSRKKIAEETKQLIQNSSKAKDRNIILTNVKDLENRLKVVAMIPGDKPTDYIDKALLLKSKGICFKNISYTKKSDTVKEVSLEGSAYSRFSLINFSKEVKASSWSTSSDIPLSNLASEKNINFFINLTASSTSR